MGPSHVVAFLLLFVGTEGRAFDPCNCEDIDEPEISPSHGFLTDQAYNDTSPVRSNNPSSSSKSGTQDGLIQKVQNNFGTGDSGDKRTRENGNSGDKRSEENGNRDGYSTTARRREREVGKDDNGANANKTERPALETAKLESSAPLASPTGKKFDTETEKSENTATDKAADNKNVSVTPITQNRIFDNRAVDGNASRTDASAKPDNAGAETSETPSTNEKGGPSTAKPQCPEHYAWNENYKQCFYDPGNVPEAKYDVYGNIDSNAGSGTTSESTPTTTVFHECPEHEKWDEILRNCYYEPELPPSARMDYYGDMFANAGR